MQDQIKPYLEAHALAWEPTTLLTEKSRLNRVAHVLDQGPMALWEALENRAPYTRKTTFIRVLQLEKWLGGTEYATWYREHRRLFKHVYKRQAPAMSFEDARVKLQSLAAPYRQVALAMLRSGMRISEVGKVSAGSVRGKGRKVRMTALETGLACNPAGLRSALKSVGLKPHDLRKLAATKLYREGMPLIDVCSVMGWSDVKTAMSYIPAESNAVERAREILK